MNTPGWIRPAGVRPSWPCVRLTASPQVFAAFGLLLLSCFPTGAAATGKLTLPRSNFGKHVLWNYHSIQFCPDNVFLSLISVPRFDINRYRVGAWVEEGGCPSWRVVGTPHLPRGSRPTPGCQPLKKKDPKRRPGVLFLAGG